MGVPKKSKRAARGAARKQQLPEPLREFLDNCVIPALVEKYLAKPKESGR